jgi:beta-lactamase superfamily II metal-dependent hydrolase
MNIAEKIIKPTKAGIFRTVFLYTGQGESTLLVIPTGPNIDDYKYVLVDSDLDKEPNEINLVTLFSDLFKTKGALEVFINTHPHDDHVGGIKEIYDEIGLTEVWHSNHKPGKKHADRYEDFKYVLGKVGKSNEFHLKGTNEDNKVRTADDDEVIKKLGLVDFVVLSPSEYLCEDIEEGDADERYNRIHEQCGVIKFTYGTEPKSILITGDSDKKAWKDHITNYHKDKLPSNVLSASHHGSRTFFKTNEEDEDVFEGHIKAIKPTYLIISAPPQKDSPYDHPHDDAMTLYKKHVDEDNILHLGKNIESVIVDIDEDGNISVITDKELIEEYGKTDDENNNDNSKKDDEIKKASLIGARTTRIDEKPMGLI